MATRAGRDRIARTTQPLPLLGFQFLSHRQTPGVRWGKGNNMNIELHEHLMRVTVDTFKKETDKLKAEIAELQKKDAHVANEWYSMRAVLMSNGFTQTPTGAWKPPLGKRPDFEGADLIKAAIEMFRASAVVQQAVQRYEEAHK
jgi:hypothetical protein